MTTVLMIILMAQSGANENQLRSGDHWRGLDVDGRQRTYLVHVPPQGNPPYPVVLAFHGGASHAEQMVQFCGLNETADRAGFIVVYPNGTGRSERALTWNGGNCCGYAMLNHVDDVNFTRALLNDLARAVAIDPKRVYATGMSNGAIMAYRLASELSDRIAAIAPVSGPMGTKSCSPTRPVSVLHFHGTADEFAPFSGGKGKRSLTQTNFYSAEYSVHAWVKADGCPETPATVRQPDTAHDGTTIIRRTYGPGKEGSEVVWITIEGGGHTWPGKQPRVYFLGKSTKNISANDVIWEFFEKHPMK